MRPIKSLTALCAAFALSALSIAPAQALTLVNASIGLSSVDTSFSDSSLVAVDFGLSNLNPATLTWTLDAGDAGRLYDFNAIVRNVDPAAPWSSLRVSLNAGSFSWVGDVYGTDPALPATLGGSATSVLATLAAPSGEIYLGDPFLEGRQNWQLSLAGLAEGQQISMSFAPAVPEPGSWALMLAGVAVLAGLARRTRC